MDQNDILVKITLENQLYLKQLIETQKKTAESTKKIGTSFQAVKTAVSNFGLGSVFQLTSVVGAVGFLSSKLFSVYNDLKQYDKEAIDKAKQREVEQAKFKQLLEETGYAAGFTADELDKYAKKLSQQSLYSKGEIKDAEAVLLRFTNIRGKAYKDAVQTAVNIAAMTGKPLDQVAEQVGRALQYPEKSTKLLIPLGAKLTKSEEDKAKAFIAAGQAGKAQELVLQKLSYTQGQAIAQTKTLLGLQDQLKKREEEDKKTYADAAMPGLKRAAELDLQSEDALDKLDEKNNKFWGKMRGESSYYFAYIDNLLVRHVTWIDESHDKLINNISTAYSIIEKEVESRLQTIGQYTDIAFSYFGKTAAGKFLDSLTSKVSAKLGAFVKWIEDTLGIQIGSKSAPPAKGSKTPPPTAKGSKPPPITPDIGGGGGSKENTFQKELKDLQQHSLKKKGFDSQLLTIEEDFTTRINRYADERKKGVISAQEYATLKQKAEQDKRLKEEDAYQQESTKQTETWVNKAVSAYTELSQNVMALIDAIAEKELSYLERRNERWSLAIDYVAEQEKRKAGVADETQSKQHANEIAQLQKQLNKTQSTKQRADLKEQIAEKKKAQKKAEIEEEAAKRKFLLDAYMEYMQIQIQRRQFERNKAYQISMVWVNALAAVAAAWLTAFQIQSSGGVWAAAIAMGAVSTALLLANAAVQTAMISQQQAPSFAVGTNYVQESGLAYIHKGEEIKPAKAVAGYTESQTPQITQQIVINGDIYGTKDFDRAVYEAMKKFKHVGGAYLTT